MKACVYLSDEERSVLNKIAKSKQLSISSCIRLLISSSLNKENEFLMTEKLEADLDSLDDLFIEAYDLSMTKGARNNLIRVYLTEEEAEYIRKAAKGQSISSYVRQRLLRSVSSRFEFVVTTDDIQELAKQNEELNMHFAGFVSALKIRSSVNNADFQYCQKLLQEINENTAELKKAVLKNRYSIRQQGRRYLEKQIRAILGEAPADDKDANS